MKFGMKLSRTLLASTALGAIVPAFAQEDAAALDEIVVTASRRSTSVQEIPYNISAVSGEKLQELNITDMTKLAQNVVGVTFIDSGARSTGLITLRGLNVGGLEAAENQGGKGVVSAYVDDTPFLRNMRLIDVERVEVLRGPQGTLYGRGSLGGTFRYILNKPDTTNMEGKVDASIYSTRRSDGFSYDVQGALNVPLVNDKLALRIAGARLDEKGFIDYDYVLKNPGTSNAVRKVEDVNNEKTTNLRASLLFQASEQFRLQGNFFYQDQKTNGRQAGNAPFTGDRYTSALRILEPQHNRDWMASVELGVETDLMSIESVTARTKGRSKGQRDQTDLLVVDVYPGYANFPEFVGIASDNPRGSGWTHETRLVSAENEMIDWIAGFYGEWSKSRTESYEYTPGYVDWAGIDTGWGDIEYLSTRRETFRENAVFGEVTVKPVDGLKITGGARSFWQKEATIDSCKLTPIYNYWTNKPLTPKCVSGGSKVDGQVYKLNVSYEFSDNAMIYSTFSQGFRSGGTNFGSRLLPQEESFGPDTVDNYEFGWHFRTDDRVLTWNGSIFQINWKNIQIPAKSVTAAENITVNGGGARVKGIENEITFRPVDAFSLTGGISYYDPKLTKNAPLVPGFAGDRLPGVAKWSFNLAADYRVDMAGGELTFHADSYYRSGAFTRLNSVGKNRDNEHIDGYLLTNAQVAFNRDNWGVKLFVDNLFDKYYETGSRGAYRYGLRGQFKYVGRPRTIGIGGNIKF